MNHQCSVYRRRLQEETHLTVQLSLFLGMLSFFGLGQKRVQTVNQLLLTRLLVFTLRKTTNNITLVTAQSHSTQCTPVCKRNEEQNCFTKSFLHHCVSIVSGYKMSYCIFCFCYKMRLD